MRLLRLLAAALLAGGLVLGISPGPAAAAVTARSGVCTSADTGAVTVVVDFASLGGGVSTRCATGLTAASRGSDALAAAGFSFASVSSQPGFACRVNGRPTADESIISDGNADYHEACAGTPPADAYWSYWKSSGDGSWDYSSSGLTASRVKIGGFEGWSFSTGAKVAPAFTPITEVVAPPPPDPPPPDPLPADPPPADPPPPAPQPTAAPQLTAGAQPPAVATTANSTRTTATVTPTGNPHSGSTASTSEPAPTQIETDPTTPVPSPVSAADSSTKVTPSTAAASTAAPVATTESTVSAPVIAAAPPSSGRPMATVGGVGLIGAIAAVGVLIGRRRRRAQ